MQLKSINGQIAYVFPRSRKLINAKARKFLETLAIWALMLALVLAVIVATVTLAAWWETQTTFSVSALKVNFPAGTQDGIILQFTYWTGA